MADRRQGISGLAALAALMGVTVAPVTVLADEDLITLPQSTAESPALTLAAEPVSDAVLDTESAKARIEIDKIVVNDQDLHGVVQGNVALNTVSGNNTIAGEAFQDTAGFVTVIQNTGNNVLIQNSTIVNVALDP
ncbi:MAG: hypothetical protein QY320_14025 [Gammaproteobacteria bacterium]|nr:MAG: hypothetical protein QY320_14025 [Gammaproteobacteria bacterium]